MVAINRSRARLDLKRITVCQNASGARKQWSYRGDKIRLILVQGSATLQAGKGVVLDIHDPTASKMNARSVSVLLEFLTRSGQRVLCRRHINLLPFKTRFLRFPLRGTWLTANARTDLHCVGTQFGLDLLRADDARFHDHPPKRPVSLSRFASFGQPVRAPAAGTVIASQGNQRDLRATLTHATFEDGAPAGMPQTVLLGNYLLMKLDSKGYLLLAHLRRGTLRVTTGDHVTEGALIGSVGNSGNTSGPHLHMELLDTRPDFDELCTLQFSASGLPFGFRDVIVSSRQKSSRSLSRFVPQKGDLVRCRPR